MNAFPPQKHLHSRMTGTSSKQTKFLIGLYPVLGPQGCSVGSELGRHARALSAAKAHMLKMEKGRKKQMLKKREREKE